MKRVQSALKLAAGKQFFTTRGVPFTFEYGVDRLVVHPGDGKGILRTVSMSRLSVWIKRWFVDSDRNLDHYCNGGHMGSRAATFAVYVARVFEQLGVPGIESTLARQTPAGSAPPGARRVEPTKCDGFAIVPRASEQLPDIGRACKDDSLPSPPSSTMQSIRSMAHQNLTASKTTMPYTQTVQSQDVCIAQLLQSFYIVPNYQREYVWRQEQVEQLLTDILEELGTESANEAPEYFIGSIVVCPGVDGTFELIDGQQRMTTIYVTLCAIQHHMKFIAQPVPGALSGQISAPSTDANGRDQFRYRLDLQYEDSRGLLVELAAPEMAQQGRRATTRSMDNIQGAYDEVRRFLKNELDNDPDLIRRFYGYFTNRVKLIRIETQDVAKALKVFETINDRGVGLDSMDLLKNLLFMRADRGTFDNLKHLWKKLQDVIFQMKEKPLRFLRYFVVSQYDVLELREDQIYAWLTKNEAVCGYGKDPLGFARALVDTARAYSNFINGRDESGRPQPQLQSLQFLSGRLRMHLIVLLAGRHLSPAQFERLLREVESLFFCFLITREHTRTIDNHLSRWAKDLRRVRTDAELEAFIASSMERQRAALSVRFDEEFARLSADSIAKYRLIYVLAKLTQQIEIDAYGENENTKWLNKFTGGGFEIEHVLAQNASAEAQIEFGEPVTPEVVQLLGNLALVEQAINGSLGNQPFSSKRGVYQQSQLLLTRSLSGRPKVGSNTKIDVAVAGLPEFSAWTALTLRQRQGFLGRLARRVWAMPDSPTGGAQFAP